MTSVEISRRKLITGLVSLVAAPAIVRVSSIMPVKAIDPEWMTKFTPIATYVYSSADWKPVMYSFYNRNFFMINSNGVTIYDPH